MDEKKEKMLFDVGVVGWWFASNYGSALTYFALANVLLDMDKKPLFIPCPKVDGAPWDDDTRITIDFLKKHFTIGKDRNFARMREYNDFVDAFMVGSDQMWRPSTSNLVGYTFYLDFVAPNKKKIAFSEKALGGITTMRDNIMQMFSIAKDAFENLDKGRLPALTVLEEDVDGMKRELIASHFARLAEGNCT